MANMGWPYSDIKDVIESLVSSLPGQGCFKSDDRTCKIYLLPMDRYVFGERFCVFVYNNEITAISAQISIELTIG